jgi:non-homologous end joining protein Ku
VQERKPTFATPRRVMNLMEALRRSVAEEEKRAAPPRVNGRNCVGAARNNKSSLTRHGLPDP